MGTGGGGGGRETPLGGRRGAERVTGCDRLDLKQNGEKSDSDRL